MKIAVLVKRVPDTASVFKIAPDNVSVDMGNPKFVMSPYDEHAVEAAIQLKEANGADVVIVCAGSPDSKDAIRSALAMGADSGLLVTGDGLDNLTPKGTAKVLAAAVKTLSADLVMAGKQAADDDAAQVPERVAELLGLPHVSVITKFEVGDSAATVTQEIEGGSQTLEAPLPALFSTEKGLNVPRYPTLPNIMKAKRKKIEEMGLGDLGLSAEEVASGLTIKAMSLPRQDRLCKILDGEVSEQVQALIGALRDDEKIL